MNNASSGVSAQGRQDPAARAGDTIVCARCQKAGSAATRFCGGCGARLWEPCPDCGETNAVDVRYCGRCGESIAERLEAVRNDAGGLLSQAETLASLGRFLDAGKLLDEIRLVDHSEFGELLTHVKQRRAEFAEQRESALSNASAILEQAKALSAEGRLREALSRALEAPEALRKAELKQLIDELTANVAEADRLREQLKAGLKSKEYVGLSVAAQRLRELEPLDGQVTSLAEKLTAVQGEIDKRAALAALQAATAALKESKYRVAHAALKKIPDVELEEKHRLAIQAAKERVWLAVQVARAPYVNESIIGVADRLVKLQPQDVKAQELQRKLTARWHEGLRKRPGQPVPWQEDKEESQLGAPVVMADAPAPLAAFLAKQKLSPQQFFVAYGLALQGIDRAEDSLDLTPKAKSWLRSMNRRSRAPAGGAWGVDLGSQSLKAVRLGLDDSDELVVHEAICFAYVRPGGDRKRPEPATEPPDFVAQALETFCADRDLANANVVIGVPGPLTLARFFKMPSVAASKMDDAIRYEARMRIPLDPEGVVYDHLTRSEPDDADEGQVRVALVAAARAHVEARLALFKGRKLKSLRVTSECVALANAMREVCGGDESNASTALVDLGAKATNVVIRRRGGCWFRGLYHGADAYDERLVRERPMTWEAAEKLRKNPTRATSMQEVDRVLAPAFEELLGQLQRTFAQFRTDQRESIGRIAFCGGGAHQLGLLRRLRYGE